MTPDNLNKIIDKTGILVKYIFRILIIIFIILKLIGIITWSWWWVLSPILLPLGFTFIMFCIFVWALNH
jgi:hypothetical protein